MNRQSPTEDVLINQDDLMTQDCCEQVSLTQDDYRWVRTIAICLHDTLDHLTVTRWLQLYPVEILFLFQLFRSKIETLALALELKKIKMF